MFDVATTARAIKGPLRTSTNRWRAAAVAAVEGGAARVSEVDLEEVASTEGPEPEREEAVAQPPTKREHSVEVIEGLAAFEVATEPIARRDLGPRGTVRMADAQGLAGRLGPKGTVKLRTRRSASSAERRSAPTFVVRRSMWRPWRIAGVLAVSAVALLAFVASRSESPPPAVAVRAAVKASPLEQRPSAPTPKADLGPPLPAVTSAPVAAPEAKHVDAAKKRPPSNASSVF